MKKYLIKIAIFLAIVGMTDFTFGKVCDYLRDHTKGGFSGNVHYICEKSREDIIMMGSSRMRHHYVPQVFEDSLGVTCYNAGIDGNGIILCYGFLEMILQRYSPKLIIYDVTGFDMYVDDNTKYLDMLKPYYDKPGISEIFFDVSPMEKWKMMSGMYRYNSNFFGLIGDNLHPMQSFEKGYWPSNKEMDYEPENHLGYDGPVADSLKLHYLVKFITLAKEKDVPIVFTASPTWFGKEYKGYLEPAKNICEEMGVPFIDNYYEKNICSDKKYWADAIHMNDKGAHKYSSMFVKEIESAIR